MAEGGWVGGCTLQILQYLDGPVLGLDVGHCHVTACELDGLLERPRLIYIIIAEVGLLEFLVENTTRSEDKESTIIELVDAVLWLGVVVWLPPRCVSGTIQVGVEKLELSQIGNILS